jgi:hypothetical protein
MTRFEYFSIFSGIVVALAIENVASSFHKLFDASGRVRWHWMAPTNAVASATATLGMFWLFWATRNTQVSNPTFLTFLPGAVAIILFYLMCAAALPDEVPDGGIDLREFYFSTRRQFWSLVVAAILFNVCVTVWRIAWANFDPRLVRANTPYLLGGLVFAAVAGSMLYVRASWWHALGIFAIASGVLVLFGPMKL